MKQRIKSGRERDRYKSMRGEVKRKGGEMKEEPVRRKVGGKRKKGEGKEEGKEKEGNKRTRGKKTMERGGE